MAAAAPDRVALSSMTRLCLAAVPGVTASGKISRKKEDRIVGSVLRSFAGQAVCHSGVWRDEILDLTTCNYLTYLWTTSALDSFCRRLEADYSEDPTEPQWQFRIMAMPPSGFSSILTFCLCGVPRVDVCVDGLSLRDQSHVRELIELCAKHKDEMCASDHNMMDEVLLKL